MVEAVGTRPVTHPRTFANCIAEVGHNDQVPATLLAHTDTPAHHERRQLGSACPKVKHSPTIDVMDGRQLVDSGGEPSPSEAAAWQGSWGTDGSWLAVQFSQ